MYDMDPRDPWDWTDYVRLWGTIIMGLVCLGGFIYLMFTYQTPISCCLCCCP